MVYKTHKFYPDGTVIGQRGTPITSITKSGYRHCYIKGESVYVHRKIYELFIGNIPDNFVVNHIDGNKLNNNINNLEAISKSEDCKHAYKTGLRIPANKKLNDLDIITIRMFSGFMSNNECAKIFGISQGLCSEIRNYKRYDY